MNGKTLAALLGALLMIGGTAGALVHMKANQRLSPPGVKTRPLADSQNLECLLPEQVLDYTSESRAQPQVVVDTLPKDTSYGQRIYTAPDKFWVQMNVVLMGADRTSIHKPQICMTGAGWNISSSESREEKIRVDRPQPYDLPVMKLVTTKQLAVQGTNITARGLYVYWFVADDQVSADAVGVKRMSSSAWKMIRSGVLQRWAYVSCFAVCLPGQEEAAYERIKKLIAASVPEFQLVPAAKSQVAAAGP